MIKFIVATTINEPTIATLKFCEIAEKKNFQFVIVGDTKTPYDAYQALSIKYKNVTYLAPKKQEKLYPELSEIIGWGTIQRRNIGFVYAYKNGAEIIATIDDDNIPYDNWGDKILIGKETEVDLYDNSMTLAFDPLSVTNHKELWHRGYPLEDLTNKNSIEYRGKKKIKPLVQAELWDGDPDIDSICRLSMKPIVKFDPISPFTSSQIMPFNSQNTFLHRSVLKNYSVLPYVGRMDDIWGAYLMQYFHPDCVVFCGASVYQERNVQDLIKNLENEIIGYRNTYGLIDDIIDNVNFGSDLDTYELFPEKTREFIRIYRSYFVK